MRNSIMYLYKLEKSKRTVRIPANFGNLLFGPLTGNHSAIF